MSRTLKTHTRCLEQTSAASQEIRCWLIIQAADSADVDRQVEALRASGALDGRGDNPFPIVRVIAPIVKVNAAEVPEDDSAKSS
jgi:hypothetical protein